ncbi:hypothetical protein [Staphylococcus borealis]|uniref:hypothetical protein n=1 Tax=Staphylococcus borealis TaxID=2742203 RepID=UPI002DB5929B|nr:hypothetical protein [Staphylococcus borealis]MEB6609265.1 hypothetical protein [Staphylococcus borealis]MEB7365254.1 hypothetical protein [Staphylococcus borealis]MEB7459448.1 hypothetical protein [Staphylococcus borealis]
MNKILKLISCICIVSLLYMFEMTHHQLHATTSNGGTSSSSSSSSSSSASSSSAATRTTSSSSSSMNRSSAVNASRASRLSSQRAAAQASKTSNIAHNTNVKNSYHSSRYNHQTRALLNPNYKYSPYASVPSQFMATNFYNNWLFYYMIANSSQEHKHSVNYQIDMLKHQMKAKETLYTVTIKTKQGDRVVVLPKHQFDKLQKGSNVKIKNGVVQP